MKKKMMIILASGMITGLAGCAQNTTSDTVTMEVQNATSIETESTVSVNDHTISMMTGDTFDFSVIIPDIQDIKFISYTTKDNIEKSQEREKEDGVSNVLLRSNGRITSFSLKGTILSIIQSDGKDEAKVEVTDKEGNKETYTVIYDCHCE